jgi:hypothetical protein
MNTLEAAIAAVVEGDLDALSTILAASHSDLLDAAAKLPQLTISRTALIRVLSVWRSGRYTAGDVGQWASFVRSGFVPEKTSGAVRPIDIEYDVSDEELIVEIIGRLDEIGDKIDGEIDENEQKEMLRLLES